MPGSYHIALGRRPRRQSSVEGIVTESVSMKPPPKIQQHCSRITVTCRVTSSAPIETLEAVEHEAWRRVSKIVEKDIASYAYVEVGHTLSERL